MNEAAEVVTTAADQNANVIFGAVIDEGRGDEVRVTVIATGFGQQRRRRPRLSDEAPGPGPAPVRPSSPEPGDLDVPSFLRDCLRRVRIAVFHGGPGSALIRP